MSIDRIQNVIGDALWRFIRTVSIEYIALVFAADFIFSPLQKEGISKYPLSYLPFALLLAAGAGLRLTGHMRQ